MLLKKQTKKGVAISFVSDRYSCGGICLTARYFQLGYGDAKNFLSHPVVEGVLRAGHPAEVGAVGLRRQRAGKGT